MRFLRRLDNAAYAFLTGHSRRDFDRVRRRRCELLAGRLLARTEARLANDWTGLLEMALGSSAQSLRSDLERLVQFFDRAAASRLAQQLDFDRASLASRRSNERLDRHFVDQPPQIVDDDGAVPAVLSNQYYGKLYYGLDEQGVGDLFLGKLRLCRRYGHDFLHLLKRFRVDACGPP